jgi:hypothetical protein
MQVLQQADARCVTSSNSAAPREQLVLKVGCCKVLVVSQQQRHLHTQDISRELIAFIHAGGEIMLHDMKCNYCLNPSQPAVTTAVHLV